MRFFHIAIAFLLAIGCSADTITLITLRNGRVINGTYLGGTPREVRVDLGDRIRTLQVSDIDRIEFAGDVAAEPEPVPVMRPAPPHDDTGTAPRAVGVTLPAGTNFVVRMIDAVDSETASVGQTFTGSLDEPVTDADGETIVPRGADVTLKLVDSKESGKIGGRAELTLSLMSVEVEGQMVDINTQTVTERSSSRSERSGKVIGGSAIGGAILGGILGGGKGAAIGAGAGAAAGAGVELATKGQRVRVPSETRLTFVLENPVRI